VGFTGVYTPPSDDENQSPEGDGGLTSEEEGGLSQEKLPATGDAWDGSPLLIAAVSASSALFFILKLRKE